jgi:hypothetical protein
VVNIAGIDLAHVIQASKSPGKLRLFVADASLNICNHCKILHDAHASNAIGMQAKQPMLHRKGDVCWR